MVSVHETRSPAAGTLTTPAELMAAIPAAPAVLAHVAASRTAIAAIAAGEDDRVMVVLGPCSIHDVQAALEYARWVQDVSARFSDRLLLVMRVYVEKARTCLGWKGLISDPALDGSGRIDEGLRQARQLFAATNALDVPIATEFIDPMVPAYLGDLVSWAAVGARTVESQIHREMASALPCPVGFKNTTGGDTTAAINAVVAAASPHSFLSIGADGRARMTASSGNRFAHVVLRGGPRPNYDAESVARVARELRSRSLMPRVLVDCGHGNSEGDYRNQLLVGRAVADQLSHGSRSIIGVMLESHLHAGAQPLTPNVPPAYGVSMTDGCLGLDDTLTLLERLDDAAK